MGAAKWIGGIIGFMVGGPLGALAGLYSVHCSTPIQVTQAVIMEKNQRTALPIPGNGTVSSSPCS